MRPEEKSKEENWQREMREARKQLWQAIKKDLAELLEKKEDSTFLSRWIDRFDPEGEYGLAEIKKQIDRVLSTDFKYIPR